MRSVFVSQLSARVTDRELGQFFDVKAGRVREAKVITDRISRRSKGSVAPPAWLPTQLTTCRVGYVEFVDLESVTKALGLTHTKLLGIPIIVQFTEAEKNRQARDGMPGGTGLPGGYVTFILLLLLLPTAPVPPSALHSFFDMQVLTDGPADST